MHFQVTIEPWVFVSSIELTMRLPHLNDYLHRLVTLKSLERGSGGNENFLKSLTRDVLATAFLAGTGYDMHQQVVVQSRVTERLR